MATMPSASWRVRLCSHCNAFPRTPSSMLCVYVLVTAFHPLAAVWAVACIASGYIRVVVGSDVTFCSTSVPSTDPPMLCCDAKESNGLADWRRSTFQAFTFATAWAFTAILMPHATLLPGDNLKFVKWSEHLVQHKSLAPCHTASCRQSQVTRLEQARGAAYITCN